MKFIKNKKALYLTFIIIILVIAVFTYIYLNKDKIEVYMQDEKKVEEVQTTNNNDLLGKITIEKIGLINAPTSEGTDLKTLENYIGHFEETALLNGNIAFCSHNRGYVNGSYFARLNELQQGDTIIYENITGQHTYIVNEVKIIDETDVSVLKNSTENKLTLITCVANQKDKRLCVTAIDE